MRTLALPSTLVALSALFLAGCAIPGARATDGCPAGETCSNDTPSGLFFLGTSTSDNIFGGGFLPTAAGGKQTVTVVTDSATDSPPFLQLFDASSTDAGVFTVDGVQPPKLTLHGGKAGHAFLRIAEHGTGKLFDRVDTRVAPVASVSLFPRDFELIIDDKKEPWAMLAGASVPLVVRLADADGNRLVDESLAFKADAGEAESMAWDLYTIKAASAGEASFKASSGGASFPVKATVVDKIDEITSATVLGSTPSPASVAAGADLILCFVARSAGVATIGSTWTFTPSSGIELPEDSNKSLGLSGCVTVHGKAAGAASLAVQTAGVSKTVDLLVTAKAAGSLLRFPKHEPSPSAGERASGAAE
jgi:hypothetical protein